MAEFDTKKKVAMIWSDVKDLELMREMGGQGIFQHKSGSRERGNMWQVIAGNLNACPGFEVTGRSIRDRFNTISKKQKAKTAKDVRGTGLGGEEPTEYELLLEELIELSNESDRKAEELSTTNKNKVEGERRKAIEIRQTAMETVGKTKKRQEDEDEDEPKERKRRRTGNETVDWLREKSKRDAELKERELEHQIEEREMQRQERNEQFKILERQMQLQSEQHQQQQQMMQQQLLAILQQQQQQTQWFMQMFKDKNM